MKDTNALIKNLLKPGDIRINGKRPWDITVLDPRTYDRVIANGSLGAGESYMDGWWDTDDLVGMLTRVDRAAIGDQLKGDWKLLGTLAFSSLKNRQTQRRAWKVGREHYDLGNDLYEAMLDKRMAYSCGYWAEAKTLDAAQEAKLDLICRKLGLKKGQHILDIGCGWGSFMFYAAEKYGVKVTGVTVSKEQAAFVAEKAKRDKLPVTAKLIDYRDLTGTYDHVVSVGMFEHVGPKNYKTYFKAAKRLLKPGGLFLLHTIGGNDSHAGVDPWIDKYIFPNSALPSIAQIAQAVEGTLVVEDWHNFGPDYALTLAAWRKNFVKAYKYLDHTKYDERFYRMWYFWLCASEAGFAAHKLRLWQVVLSHGDLTNTYRSVR